MTDSARRSATWRGAGRRSPGSGQPRSSAGPRWSTRSWAGCLAAEDVAAGPDAEVLVDHVLRLLPGAWRGPVQTGRTLARRSSAPTGHRRSSSASAAADGGGDGDGRRHPGGGGRDWNAWIAAVPPADRRRRPVGLIVVTDSRGYAAPTSAIAGPGRRAAVRRRRRWPGATRRASRSGCTGDVVPNQVRPHIVGDLIGGRLERGRRRRRRWAVAQRPAGRGRDPWSALGDLEPAGLALLHGRRTGRDHRRSRRRRRRAQRAGWTSGRAQHAAGRSRPAAPIAALTARAARCSATPRRWAVDLPGAALDAGPAAPSSASSAAAPCRRATASSTRASCRRGRRLSTSPCARRAASASATCPHGAQQPRRYRCQPTWRWKGSPTRADRRRISRGCARLRARALGDPGLPLLAAVRSRRSCGPRRRRLRAGRVAPPRPHAAHGEPRRRAAPVPPLRPGGRSRLRPVRGTTMHGDITRRTFDPPALLVGAPAAGPRADRRRLERRRDIECGSSARRAPTWGGAAGAPAPTRARVTSRSQGGSLCLLQVGRGRYYVDGIRIENAAGTAMLETPDRTAGTYLVYLDVWELQRHRRRGSHDPRGRPGRPRHRLRKVTWRVRLLPVTTGRPPPTAAARSRCGTPWSPAGAGEPPGPGRGAVARPPPTRAWSRWLATAGWRTAHTGSRSTPATSPPRWWAGSTGHHPNIQVEPRRRLGPNCSVADPVANPAGGVKIQVNQLSPAAATASPAAAGSSTVPMTTTSAGTRACWPRSTPWTGRR